MSSIQELKAICENWEDRVRRQSREEGLRMALMAVFEARFEAVSDVLRGAIEAMEDEGTLRRWAGLFATRTREEIEAAVLPAA